MATPFHPAAGAQPHSAVFPDQLSTGLQQNKIMRFERVANNPAIVQHGTQAAPVTVPTLPTAVQDNVNTIYVPGAFGCKLIEMYQTTAQTLMPSRHATKGLSVALDLVDNESVEYVFGGNHAANPLGYLAGTDNGIYMEATLEFEDADGIDQLVFGVRKQQNYVVPGATAFYNGQAPTYTDLVGLGFGAAVANPNVLRSITAVGSATSVTTSTGFTIADGGIHRLGIFIRGRAVRYFLNGRLIGDRITVDGLGASITPQNTITPPAYSVTSGLFMVPFLFVRQDALLSDLFIRRLIIGAPKEWGLDPAARGAGNPG